jgi:hypothetical protein
MIARTPMRGPRIPMPPRLVVTLFAIDLLIALAFVANLVVETSNTALARHVGGGLFHSGLARHLHPGVEANLPTWYSSIQWALAGVVFAVYAAVPAPDLKRGIRLCLPAVGAMLLSLDEAAGIHEWFGQRTDALLPDGTREGTLLSVSGIWMLILIPLAVVAAIWVARLLGDHLRAAPSAASLLAVGAILFVLGAGVLEVLTNFADDQPARFGVQILEEFAEMLAATTVVWGGLEMLRLSGVRISRESVRRT